MTDQTPTPPTSVIQRTRTWQLVCGFGGFGAALLLGIGIVTGSQTPAIPPPGPQATRCAYIGQQPGTAITVISDNGDPAPGCVQETPPLDDYHWLDAQHILKNTTED